MTKPIFRPKNYCHFDRKSHPNPRIISYVKSPLKVAEHSFYPFLSFQTRSFKFPKKKKNKPKIRPLYYSAHIDRYIYQYYSHLLKQPYESFLSKNSLDEVVAAYRDTGKSNIHFAAEAFSFLSQNPTSIVYCFDIEGFFDHLNHAILKRNICTILNKSQLPTDHYKVFRSITKFSSVSKAKALEALKLRTPNLKTLSRLCSPEEFREKIRNAGQIKTNENDFGIPQGSSISATYSNIYMIEFDQELSNFVNLHDGFYRRYSDDIIAIFPNPQFQKEFYRQKFEDEIRKIELTISKSKTEFTRFKEGKRRTKKPVQYLGFTFENGAVRIRPKTITKYYGKLYARIKIIKIVQWHKNNKKAFRKRFYSNYSHLGKNNFLSYVERAAEIFKEYNVNEKLTQDTKKHWNKIFKAFKKKY